MHQASNSAHYSHNVQCALDWLVGMQSRNGGFASFDVEQHPLLPQRDSISRIMARSWIRLRAMSPPRVVTVAGAGRAVTRTRRRSSGQSLSLRAEQEADGSWFRPAWGTNYIYGTWSVLTAIPRQAGISPDDPATPPAP